MIKLSVPPYDLSSTPALTPKELGERDPGTKYKSSPENQAIHDACNTLYKYGMDKAAGELRSKAVDYQLNLMKEEEDARKKETCDEETCNDEKEIKIYRDRAPDKFGGFFSEEGDYIDDAPNYNIDLPPWWESN